MKLNVIRGIGRCCTRGFAGAEVVGTVGQWADSGAWDYFVKHGTHTESQKQCCLPAACDSSTVQRNNCQRPQLYQITTQQMEKANIRRLICSGLRYALLYITAIAERGRGGLPKQKLTAPLGHKEEFCCRGDAVRSFTLKTTCQAAICDLLTFKYQ